MSYNNILKHVGTISRIKLKSVVFAILIIHVTPPSFAKNNACQNAISENSSTSLGFLFVGKNDKAINFIKHINEKPQTIFETHNSEIILKIAYNGKDLIAVETLSCVEEERHKTSIIFTTIKGNELSRYVPDFNRVVLSLSFCDNDSKIALVSAKRKRTYINNNTFEESVSNYQLHILDVKYPNKQHVMTIPNGTTLPSKAWLGEQIISENYCKESNQTSIILFDYKNKDSQTVLVQKNEPTYFGVMLPSVYSNNSIGFVSGDKYVAIDNNGKIIKTLITEGAKEKFKPHTISIDSPIYWISNDMGLFLNRLGETISGWYIVELNKHSANYTKLPNSFNDCIENLLLPVTNVSDFVK